MTKEVLCKSKQDFQQYVLQVSVFHLLLIKCVKVVYQRHDIILQNVISKFISVIVLFLLDGKGQIRQHSYDKARPDM